MNAAVVGLLIVVALRLAWVAIHFPAAGRLDALNLTLLIVCLVLLLRGFNATWIILLSGLLGLGRWFLAR